MLDPKPTALTDMDGRERHYVVHRIPYMEGREIFSQFFTTDAPQTGDYKENERLSEKMFQYVAVVLDDGKELLLKTRDLINNHVPDYMTGMKLEKAMVEHNVGFDIAGEIHDTQQALSSSLNLFLSRMLTQWQAASSEPGSAPSANSGPSTP